MTRTVYRGWGNCHQLSNGVVDLIVTTDVGPRIIRFGFMGDDNEFKEYADDVGRTGGDEWRLYGGHRLWHAPEARPRTYFPDNAPVRLEDLGRVTRVIQPVEPTTGIQKEIDIQLPPGEAQVTVTHRLRNCSLWPVKLAPWALSVMAPGGRAIIPLPPRGSHEDQLLPTNTLTLWAYTNMSDPRWTWGGRYILLRQDPDCAGPQKIGAMVPDGWAAYARNGHLFLKKFHFVAGATYPDFGCSVETFTNADMLELETLGPMTRLPPGGEIEHVEHWFLFKDVPVVTSDDEVDQHVVPRVTSAKTE